MSKAISGMIAATLTPYRADGQVDAGMIHRHVEYLIAGGIPAVSGATARFAATSVQ